MFFRGIFIIGLGVALPAGGTEPSTGGSPTNAANDQDTDKTTTAAQTSTEPVAALSITDVKVGAGKSAVNGKTLTLHYVGSLPSGKTFDSSRERAAPLTFILGNGVVIPGWEQGLAGMKVGGVRRLIVPPQLAYGNRPVIGVIPPNATLTFEIELLDVQ